MNNSFVHIIHICPQPLVICYNPDPRNDLRWSTMIYDDLTSGSCVGPPHCRGETKALRVCGGAGRCSSLAQLPFNLQVVPPAWIILNRIESYWIILNHIESWSNNFITVITVNQVFTSCLCVWYMTASSSYQFFSFAEGGASWAWSQHKCWREHPE
jgi:hypothetical protein